MQPPIERVGYSPIVDRPVVRWPNGERLAVWISPNVEHYEYLPPHNPVKDPYVGRLPHPDIREYSSRDYGNRAGIWRMTDTLDKFGTRCTVSLNLGVLDHFPEIAELIRERDWSVMSHGIFNTRYIFGMSAEEELEFYRDSIETLKRHTGLQLKGMLGPAISGSYETPDLMAEAGLIYHADWVHDDQPVPIKVKQGRLISVPYSYELDDAPMFFKHFDGEYFREICFRQFDRLYEAGKETAQVMCIALHPFEIGQPHNIGYLHDILEYISRFDDVWHATADEIAEYYLANYYDAEVAYAKSLEGED